ncbi:Ig-like domain-containing protein [Candidatus Dojkabacteria bacterium]|uniref:Ig-like domain-containing protein n=1 Tax=Candidatus Dojkabacteria bacterium TaxID=2099670 RepID=A0A955L2M0_9BACT|nr:Ig-like domain-containing protein [Candidatus Dojkabacteria bacterium]
MENNQLSEEEKVSQYLDAILSGANIKGRGETPVDNELIELAYQIAEAYKGEDAFASNEAISGIDKKFNKLKETNLTASAETEETQVPNTKPKQNKLKMFFANNHLLHNKKFIAGFSTFLILFALTGLIGLIYVNNGNNGQVNKSSERDFIDLANVELVKTAESINGVKTKGGSFEIKFADNKLQSDQDVAQYIKIDPTIEVTTEVKDNGQTISITPKQDLEAGKEYSVQMIKGLKFEDDTVAEFDRSWKFATEPTFAIIGITPKDGETYIPLDSTIEFEFNYSNIDANEFAKFVSINPKVDGKYEVVNRKIVFLPKSLYPNTGYTVTIKKGFKNSDGNEIKEDKVFQFTTSSTTSDNKYIDKPYITAYPTPLIGSYASNPKVKIYTNSLNNNVKADIYAITKEGIVQFVQRVNSGLNITLMPEEKFLKKVGSAEFSIDDGSYKVMNYDFNDKSNYLIDIYSDEVPYHIQRVVSITDYDILVESGNKKTDMWVYDYNKLNFVKGAKIEVYSKNGTQLKQILTGTSTDGGNLNYETASGNPDLVIGTIDKSEFYAASGAVPDYLYDNYPTSDPEGFRTYMYTDKPVYKRGDEVNFKYIVRAENDYNFSPPKDTKVTIRVESDHTIFEKEYSVDEWGSVVGTFPVPDNSAVSRLNVYARINNTTEYSAKSLQIAQFEKGQYEINVKTDKQIIKNGMKSEAIVSVKTYDGKPYTGDVVVKTYMQNRGVDDWVDGVGNENPTRAYNQNTYDQQTIQLSNDGIGKVTVQPLVSKQGNSSNHQAYDFTIEVSAQGSNNITQTEYANLLVWEDGKRLSSRVNAGINASEGAEVQVDLKSTDPLSGNIQNNTDINYKIIRKYSFREEIGEHYDEATKSTVKDYRTTSGTDTVKEGQINTGGSGIASLKFKTEKFGDYYINLSSGEGNNLVDTRNYLVYVPSKDQKNNSYDDISYDEGLQMKISSGEQNVGDTIDIELNTDLKAEGLFLIKRGEVYEWKVLNLENAKKLSYTLDKRAYPSVDVSVYYPSAGYFKTGASDVRKELLANASRNVTVNDPNRELNVTISGVNSEYKPGDEVTAGLTVTDANGKPVSAELSLAVVDKAIVDQYGDNSDYIVDKFTQTINQKIFVSYNRIDDNGYDGGGRGDGGPGYTRADIKDVGYWNGKIVTDASGKAEVKFKMPDNITGWVITSVGMDKTGRVARTQTETVTTQDFSMNFDLPEYLRSNDTLNTKITVTNYTTDSHKGELKVSSKDCKVSPETTALSLIGISEKTTYVRLTPGTTSTQCVFTANFYEGDKLLDGLEKTVKVLAGSYFESNVVSSKVNGDNTFKFNVTKTADRNSAMLYLQNSIIDDSYKQPYEIDIDSSPRLNGVLLANIELYENWDKLGMQGKKTDLEKLIEDQLSKLYMKQDKTGGISYFGYDANGIQETAFAAYAAGKLERNGFIIQHDFKNGLLNYLRNTILSDKSNYDEKMLALRGLSYLSSSETLASSSYLFSHRKDFADSPWAYTLLGNTLFDLGSISDAQIIADELVGMSKSGSNYAFWLDNSEKYKDPHTKELISSEAFELYSKVGGYEEFRTNILNWLLENGNGGSYEFESRFISSKVLGYALDYNSKEQNATVTFNGQQVYSGNVNGIQAVELKTLNTGENTVVINSNGLFAKLQTNLLADEKSEIPTDVKITTEYFDLLTGAKLTTVKEGQFVKIRNTIASNIDGKRLTVRNSLPAGLVILDGYYTQIDQEQLMKFFDNQSSNKWSNNMVEFNDFNEYEIKKSKVYTFDTLAIAKYSGTFDTGASQAFFASFTDLSGLESSRQIEVK